jgi:hypothetical protein
VKAGHGDVAVSGNAGVHRVGELYVDLAGMDGLYNQVLGVHHDARAASEHIDKHASMPFYEEGIIFMLAGTHRRARQLIEGTLDAAAARASTLATTINQCQVLYAKSDQTAREQFDAAFPGPGTVAVSDVIHDMRPTLPTSGAPFTDVTEPTAHLRTPEWAAETVRFQMNYLWDSLSPSSWIRQISVWVLNYDPFEAWLKLLSGDWSGYYRCAVVWQQISSCANDLATNLLRAARDTPLVWRGNAATTTEAILVANAAVLDQLAEAGLFYSDRYRDAAQAAINCFDTVSSLANDLVDRLFVAGVAAPNHIHPLDRAVLTAALTAPETRGVIAELARDILSGRLTIAQAARSMHAAPIADAAREGLAEAIRRAQEDPRVADEIRRISNADWTRQ